MNTFKMSSVLMFCQSGSVLPNLVTLTVDNYKRDAIYRACIIYRNLWSLVSLANFKMYSILIFK